MCKNKSFQSSKMKNKLFKIQERKTKTKTIKKKIPLILGLFLENLISVIYSICRSNI
jgi:uncharacterized membrane protein